METRRMLQWIVCAALAGCSGARPATTEERAFALSMVGMGRAVRDLGSPASTLNMPAPDPTGPRTIAPAPGFACTISGESQVGAESQRTGTCNGGDLTVDLSYANEGDRYHAEITLAGRFQGGHAYVHQIYALQMRTDFLDGTWTEDNRVELPSSMGRRNTTITFDSVTLDESGCAVGGQIHADREERIDQEHNARSLDFVMGPGCGQIALLP